MNPVAQDLNRAVDERFARMVSKGSRETSPPLAGVRVKMVWSSGLSRATETMYCTASNTPPARSRGANPVGP